LKGSDDRVSLEIKLPKHIAEWLKEFAEENAMDPSQFLAIILTYYYEAYNKGYEKCYSQIKAEITISDLPQLAEIFIKEGKVSGGVIFIVRRFASWAKDELRNISELNNNIISMFLEEYMKTNQISKTSLSVYRSTIRKFIEFVFQKTKTAQDISTS